MALEVVCIGCSHRRSPGAGKTLLGRCLAHYAKHGSVWTVGQIPPWGEAVDVERFDLAIVEKTGRREVLMHEKRFDQNCPLTFPNAHAILIAVDSADPYILAHAAVGMSDVLSNNQEIATLVCFTKADIDGPITLTEVQNMMLFEYRIKDAERTSVRNKPLKHCHCSAQNGNGIEEIVKWLQSL